jgi:hypothetical protein
MHEYYARFFREVGQNTFTFWKGQVVGGVVAGVITAIVNGINGVTPAKVVWASVAAVVLGYLALLGIGLICAVITAPVKVDQRRLTEIELSKANSTREIAAHIEEARQQTVQRVRAETALQQEIARKHPHDEHKEKPIAEALHKLNDPAHKFLAWLLHTNRAGNVQIFSSGFHGIPGEILANQGATQLLTYEVIRSSNGTEIDRAFSINPEFAPILRETLYPARPVTPPPPQHSSESSA